MLRQVDGSGVQRRRTNPVQYKRIPNPNVAGNGQRSGGRAHLDGTGPDALGTHARFARTRSPQAETRELGLSGLNGGDGDTAGGER
jgi:hypothetical protein